MSDEANLVASRYSMRLPVGDDPRYNMLNPAMWLNVQERQRVLIRMLDRYCPKPLQEASLLEIGCGAGGNLLDLIRLGFNPQNLVANELLPDRVALARRNLPSSCHVLSGDALAVDFMSKSFDIIYQSMVFTSLLDFQFRQELAQKIWQLLRPDGAILWYDFVYNNPSNKDVRGVSLRRVKLLFPEGIIQYKRLTLAPPIARIAVKLHPLMYHCLNTLPFLRSHVMCWITKN